MVDLVVINKADGDLLPIATRAAAEYRTAINLLHPKNDIWKPQVKICSALGKRNIDVSTQNYQVLNIIGCVENDKKLLGNP